MLENNDRDFWRRVGIGKVGVGREEAAELNIEYISRVSYGRLMVFWLVFFGGNEGEIRELIRMVILTDGTPRPRRRAT